ncbi:LemA family protein [Candidatus Falkowbacteria bacterium]|jgi:LemA protein|nr:LemA family protein [Candidatus Falkowbacteria bacterium]
MKKKKGLIILLIIIALIAIWLWRSYNSLVTVSEGVDNQWAQVEVQYQRRFDLIPNLVEAVKGVMSQEQAVFGDLAAARENYTGATTVNAKAEAATQVENSLGRLLAIMENYPELKSAETVQNLMTQLEGTENRVSVERGRFNEAVKSFNVLIKRFPMNFVSNLFNYSEKAYFQVAAGVENAPVVDLNLN